MWSVLILNCFAEAYISHTTSKDLWLSWTCSPNWLPLLLSLMLFFILIESWMTYDHFYRFLWLQCTFTHILYICHDFCERSGFLAWNKIRWDTKYSNLWPFFLHTPQKTNQANPAFIANLRKSSKHLSVLEATKCLNRPPPTSTSEQLLELIMQQQRKSIMK